MRQLLKISSKYCQKFSSKSEFFASQLNKSNKKKPNFNQELIMISKKWMISFKTGNMLLDTLHGQISILHRFHTILKKYSQRSSKNTHFWKIFNMLSTKYMVYKNITKKKAQ